MNRIIYGDKGISFQKYGGISRYFSEIVKRVYNSSEYDVRVSALFFDNVYFSDFFYLTGKKKYSSKGKLGKLINRLLFFTDILGAKKLLVHSTYYDIFPDYYVKRAKHVTTIHDMIYERNLVEDSGDTVKKKKYHIYNSDAIIAVSEWTKKEILEIYPDINPQKISVIYHGNSLIYHCDKNCILDLPPKYILFVGQRKSYKNFYRLLLAYCELAKAKSDIKLVCSGTTFDDEEQKLLKQFGIEKNVIQRSFSDDELANAYREAICFVYPSLYEGFGIPILEAWACECPVVLSNIPVFREVAKDAAMYFDPMEPSSIYQKLLLLCENEKMCHTLVDKGKKALLDYTWDNAAKKTMQLYNSLLD